MKSNPESECAIYEGFCVGCEIPDRLDSTGLCPDCAAKLERDLIRERDWDYSAAAYGLREADREELRRAVIKQFGEAMELIAPPPSRGQKRSRHKLGDRGRANRKKAERKVK